MNKNKKNNDSIQFQMDGMLKLEKVGDFLKLREKKIKLILKKKEEPLETRKINTAYVVDLSETGTHLTLKNICIKKYFFFAKHVATYNVPINNISTIQILKS